MNENEYISASQRGARISGLRADRGFTLRELAGRLGVSASTLSRYEAGLVERIPQPTMEKLAVLLGTSPAYLQYGRDDPEASAAEGAAPQIQSKPTDYLHIYRASELSRLYRAGQLDEREFVLIVEAKSREELAREAARQAPDPIALARTYVREGMGVNEAAKRAAKETGAKKSDIYRSLTENA